MSERDSLLTEDNTVAETAWNSLSEKQELLRACAAELIATMLFVLLAVTTAINAEYAAALHNGFLIFVLVAMTTNVSGGHINPAVSLGVWLAGEISFVRFILYFLAQLIGASIGGALAVGLNETAMLVRVKYGTSHPDRIDGYGDGQAMGMEIFTTFVLVTTFLTNAVDRKGFKNMAPLCIGFAVAAGSFATSALSGGSMNPAGSFGPAMASLHALKGDQYTSSSYYDMFWKDQWIYFVGPFLGAAAAAVNYRLLLASHPLKPVHVQ